MKPTRPSGRRAAFGLLAFLLVAFPSIARSDDLDDVRKQIADTEKQLADLQKKLDELKGKKVVPSGPGTVPAAAVKKMTWRSIGPANMGGRIVALAVVESDPTTYYVATASGGLLKTTNNGTTFSHLFDHEATVSLGDVAVAPSDPNTVWVGTGENNPRNSVSYGDGVYKSTDAGKSWQNMGLKKSYSIGKIVIHPKDPNTVYVGALGRVYGPNEERGLFKTVDGGKTWAKILYVDDKTGVIDFRMDPFDPNSLLVGMWERKRDGFDTTYGPASEWYSTDQYGPEVTYGPGGGLFRSTDAGKTWKKLTGEKGVSGLPAVKTGRIGVDYSRKTKGLVYAIIDTEKIGGGREPLTVYLGISSDNAKGGGVQIDSVADDGSFVKAGVKDNDVLVALDGIKIANYDAMIDFMSKKKPGDVVKVTVKRGDKDVTVDVKLLPRPSAAPKTASALVPGFVPQVTDFETPVKVASAPKDGAAEKAGVKAGMEVLAVEGKPVANWIEFRTELRVSPKAPDARKAGDKVKVTFRSLDKDKKESKFDAVLALEPLEFALPPGGAGGRANPARPFLADRTIGGQLANVQKDQGKDGVNTGGVYKSADGGETWTRVNSVNPRPFYFSQVRCDPSDDKVVYILGDGQPNPALYRSTDGGERFTGAPTRGVHPDVHALWIDPKDSRHLILGCDGGFYTTHDRGETWDHLNIRAIGQFYHVAVDNKKPYNVYGGLQDNGSWGGPSQTLRGTGPTNDDWLFIQGGDGFVCRVDPVDPDVVYSESQGGRIEWQNLRTGERGFASARKVKEDEDLRFNWNTPFILSHHNPRIFYSGAQYVFRSINRGASTKAISPDLTSSKKATISAIAESPKNADVLWAGTDDGNLWVTRDGGAKWENVLDKLKAAGLPGPRWVSTIEPSRTVEGRCYVCLDAHRSDDDKPYLYFTEDYGATWKPITNNLPAFGSTRCLREDHTNPNVLYCGTEFGIWVSVNRGAGWANLNNNLPTVAVHEVAQPTTASEIVVATHGRSVWVLDVASVRQMSVRTETVGKDEKKTDPLTEAVTLFAPPVATRWKMEGGREFPYSPDVRKFYGTNPAFGTQFDYLLTKPAKVVSLKVTDVSGNVVRAFNGISGDVGFHRLLWALSGPRGVVPAGGYRVTLTVDGKDYVQTLTVENDPKADPKAIISFDLTVPGGEDGAEEEWGAGVEIVPFIPKAKD